MKLFFLRTRLKKTLLAGAVGCVAPVKVFVRIPTPPTTWYLFVLKCKNEI